MRHTQATTRSLRNNGNFTKLPAKRVAKMLDTLTGYLDALDELINEPDSDVDALENARSAIHDAFDALESLPAAPEY